MKLNRRRLRRLIKEELQLLNEGPIEAVDYLKTAVPRNEEQMKRFINRLSGAINQYYGSGTEVKGLPGPMGVIAIALKDIVGGVDLDELRNIYQEQGEMRAIGR